MEKPQTKLSNGQVVKWKEQEIPSVYANIMGIGMSPFDITLTFGEVGDSTPTEVMANPRAKVILSPEQAANLIKLLNFALTTYVENNGQLRTSGAVDIELFSSQVKAQLAKVGK
jgi:hypothetical protein